MPPADADSEESLEAEIYQRFFGRLRLFAARRVDAASAEDVAQETLRRVVEALRDRRIENLEALPAFVFQTARNICMHYGRSARRERGALRRFSFGTPPVASDDVIAVLVSRERMAVVRDAISQLDGSDQQLLRLLFIDALETRVIAQRLSIDPGTLRVRKHRLLRRLAQLVGNESPQSGTQG